MGYGRVGLSSYGQSFGELKQLVKPGCTWENEGCRIEHDAVADARSVGVGEDEAAVSAIVGEGGAEVKADAPVVVPFGAAGVVGDQEGATD